MKIIEQSRYDDELSVGYKREILDHEKVYDSRAKVTTNKVQVIATYSSRRALGGANLNMKLLTK